MVRVLQCLRLSKNRAFRASSLQDMDAEFVVESRLPMLLGACHASPVARIADELPPKRTTADLSRTTVPEHALPEASVPASRELRSVEVGATAPAAGKAGVQLHENPSVCSTECPTTLDPTVEEPADGLSSDDEQPLVLAERNREVVLADRRRIADRQSFLSSSFVTQ